MLADEKNECFIKKGRDSKLISEVSSNSWTIYSEKVILNKCP